jgi:hypothetical protein
VKSEDAHEGAREKIRQAFVEGKWAGRSIAALSTKAALPPERTLQILRQDLEIGLAYIDRCPNQ